ncbi:MAG: hypothetical protein WBG02_11495 [Candidatus Acidiferrum sp.]
MPTKTKKKQSKSKKSKAARKKPAKKASPGKKPARKKAPRLAPAKSKAAPKKARTRGKREQVDSVVFQRKGLGPGSAGQSGDLQGLSNRGRADSESVDELLEEGNALEAEAVEGVEDALDPDEGEVRTHEVPEDDVPDEYLEKDE